MMRRHRHNATACTVGKLAVAAGVLILLWMILPAGFWWFVFAVALIVLGIKIARSC